MKRHKMTDDKKKKMRLNLFTFTISLTLLSALLTQSASAKDTLGKKWPATQQVSMDDIDHASLSTLLKKYVDADGYVNYQAWKDSSKDRRALQIYLAQLGRASLQKRASKSAQLAFWINAYNAATLEGILQLYPTTSIRNHTARFVGYNIWTDLPLHVGDQAISLNDIEHKLLRKMNEPRIHFAIVCASVSCPRLRNEAYTSKDLDRQLADNSIDFFTRAQNFRVDIKNRTIHVSSILDWFDEDFGKSQVDRFRYLQKYLPQSAQQISVAPNTAVKFIKYNWNLNDQANKPQTVLR